MKFAVAIITIFLYSINNSNGDVDVQSLYKLVEKLVTTVEQVQNLKSQVVSELGTISLNQHLVYNAPSRNHTPSVGVGVDADPTKQYNLSEKYFTSCYDVLKSGYTTSGIYVIKPNQTEQPFEVLCDMELEGGGWTHIQKRVDGRTDFYRGWRDYRFGFGFLDTNREFWLGLEKIHKLTEQQINELMVEIVDRKGQKAYALYKNFAIGREEDAYPLKTLSRYSGNAGDALTYHAGMKFSTFDFDQDNHTGNCAEMYKGAWWYNACHMSNLNGKYINVDLPDVYSYVGLSWRTYGPDKYCHASARMLIRPSTFE